LKSNYYCVLMFLSLKRPRLSVGDEKSANMLWLLNLSCPPNPQPATTNSCALQRCQYIARALSFRHETSNRRARRRKSWLTLRLNFPGAVKLWKKDGSNTGWYKVYNNCEDGIGQDGKVGCYLHFYCLDWNTDDLGSDC
jgi:hypothetical protein